MSLDKFLERFGNGDAVANHNLQCEMVARAIKAIGDSTKFTHAGGTCWRHPKVTPNGYGVTSVLHKTYIASRLVLCCATGKPYDYHNDAGEYMTAAHKSPVICRYRDCLNPEHLYWETASDGCKRREAEARARTAVSELGASIVSLEVPLSS